MTNCRYGLPFTSIGQIGRIDVDNRAKDVMDALQGLTGGFGTKVLGIRNSSKLHREINIRYLPFIA